MDNELMIFNIRKYCAGRNLKPTIACMAAGVGRSYVSNLARGQSPSVASVSDLAAYLGVSTSDLGDAKHRNLNGMANNRSGDASRDSEP